MRIGSLFAGYGGLERGVQAVIGGNLAWYSEIDPAPSRILAHHHPDIPNLGDITAVDWAEVEPVDVVTGGFPCQDLSAAGKRAGLRPGTRSGLWEHMAYAIASLRPRLVVIENVRGLLSAGAHSEMEPCPWCVGDAGGQPVLRALGAVLGDLANVGYDARWIGLRAADAGAPHGRFRVFIIAYPAIADPSRIGGHETLQHDGREAQAGHWAGVPDQPDRQPDGLGPGRGLALLRTPMSTDAKGGVTDPTERMSRGIMQLRDIAALLPTPTAQDSAGSRNSTANRSPNAKPAAIGDTLTDIIWKEFNGRPTQARPDQVLPDLRCADEEKALWGEQHPGGHGEVHGAQDLRSSMRKHQDRDGNPGGPSMASPAVQSGILPGLRGDDQTARSPHRPEPGEQRSGEPDDALRLLSPQAALAGGPGQAGSEHAPEPPADMRRVRGAVQGQMGQAADLFSHMQSRAAEHQDNRSNAEAWGQYAPAILRWEMVLGRAAPNPTEPGRDGRHRLSARAVEHMMGLPAGWVTSPAIGLTRAQQLKALGNGVVPQQAALALRLLGVGQ